MKAAPLSTSRILLVIGGGIAAYKSLELIRRLRERDATVRVVLTAAAQQWSCVAKIDKYSTSARDRQLRLLPDVPTHRA